MAFTFGFLTINGKKASSTEEIQLEGSRENDEIFVTDEVEADELAPTRLKYKLTIKRAWTDAEYFKAMQAGTPVGAIIFKKDQETKKVTSLFECKGGQFEKITFGPITGNKHVIEDMSIAVAKVKPL